MRFATAALALVFLPAPAEAQTTGTNSLNWLSVGGGGTFYNPPVPPCSPQTVAGFASFHVFSTVGSTAAVLFVSPLPTSCGLLPFPPGCAFYPAPPVGPGVTSLDVSLTGVVALPLTPSATPGTFSSGLIFPIPPGLQFSIQGAIMDLPLCPPRGFVFTNAYDVTST